MNIHSIYYYLIEKKSIFLSLYFFNQKKYSKDIIHTYPKAKNKNKENNSNITMLEDVK